MSSHFHLLPPFPLLLTFCIIVVHLLQLVSQFGTLLLTKVHDLHKVSLCMGFPGGSGSKESACNVGDLGSIPGLGRSPGEGNGYPLQHAGLENPMDCRTHGVATVRHNSVTFTLRVIHYRFWLMYMLCIYTHTEKGHWPSNLLNIILLIVLLDVFNM